MRAFDISTCTVISYVPFKRMPKEISIGSSVSKQWAAVRTQLKCEKKSYISMKLKFTKETKNIPVTDQSCTTHPVRIFDFNEK